MSFIHCFKVRNVFLVKIYLSRLTQHFFLEFMTEAPYLLLNFNTMYPESLVKKIMILNYFSSFCEAYYLSSIVGPDTMLYFYKCKRNCPICNFKLDISNSTSCNVTSFVFFLFQLETIYSNSPALKEWYKQIRIDGFR